MLIIRNLSVENGLCNGTKVQILTLKNDLIVCKHVTGVRGEREEKIDLYRYRFIFGGN
jgi:hypothetical protein